METKRIFIAIKIHHKNQIRKILPQVQLDLKDEWIKWVDLNGLHITLGFIGATDVRKLELIKMRLRQCGNLIPPFQIRLKALGAFPSINKARVLWFGVDGDNSIYDLRNELVNQLEHIVDFSDTKFSPHVTFGRIKHGVKNPEMVKQKLESYNEWYDETFWVKEFVLMESKLSQDGSVYEVLDRFALKEA
ncbi:RNA 2',3'-cyclic phosphodiesterase [Marinifilum caeruleilacunae]|uniref:RNA 2',3'-cyclic phosphodiesterase n=1 Tax=Marinifilum caeruleilacunae TaxID=2499076 RepID=UPI0014926F05